MSVYKITVGDKFYFGSTHCGLDERIRTHKTDYDRVSSKLYIAIKEAGGWDNVTIECVMECDAPKLEEDRLVRLSWDDPLLLNERRVAVSDEEKRKENREYFARLKESAPERLREYAKRAYEKRKTTEAYQARTKAYREAHRAEMAERQKLKFASLTREQRDEINRKKRERRAAHKACLLNQ